MPRNAEPTWDSGRVKDLLSSTGGRADSDLRVTLSPTACVIKTGEVQRMAPPLFCPLDRWRSCDVRINMRQSSGSRSLPRPWLQRRVVLAGHPVTRCGAHASMSVADVCDTARRSASHTAQTGPLRNRRRQLAPPPTGYRRRRPRSRCSQAPNRPALRRRDGASESRSTGARPSTGALKFSMVLNLYKLQ